MLAEMPYHCDTAVSIYIGAKFAVIVVKGHLSGNLASCMHQMHVSVCLSSRFSLA